MSNSEVPEGYKLTEIGVIPEDWDVAIADEICELIVDCKNRTPPVIDGGEFAVVRTPNVRNGRFVQEELRFTDEKSFQEWTARAVPQIDDILITREAPLGEVCFVPNNLKVCLGQRMMLYRPDQSKINCKFFLYALIAPAVQSCLVKKIGGSTVGHAKVNDIRNLEVPFPRQKDEQEAIATTLSDVDALIAALEKLIAKKLAIKTATMQQLLTSKKRLPGFGGEWEVKQLDEVSDCLDNLRIPLNESQRGKISGSYPYCGANGVLDFVNDYVLDDDVILIAEDGGYFDEYEHRPIAYRMSGKIWVNNHAHILKAKAGFSQGLLYFSLVHKNILPYLASGTRAKLNRSEMNKITINLPLDENEQTAIATVLSDMDTEISALEARLDKTQAIKQGMMQELLTGRTRLI